MRNEDWAAAGAQNKSLCPVCSGPWVRSLEGEKRGVERGGEEREGERTRVPAFKTQQNIWTSKIPFCQCHPSHISAPLFGVLCRMDPGHLSSLSHQLPVPKTSKPPEVPKTQAYDILSVRATRCLLVVYTCSSQFTLGPCSSEGVLSVYSSGSTCWVPNEENSSFLDEFEHAGAARSPETSDPLYRWRTEVQQDKEGAWHRAMLSHLGLLPWERYSESNMNSFLSAADGANECSFAQTHLACVCMSMYVGMLVCVCVPQCLHTHTGDSQSHTSSVAYILRQSVSLNLELSILAKVAAQWVPGIYLSLPPQNGDYRKRNQTGCAFVGTSNLSGCHVWKRQVWQQG